MKWIICMLWHRRFHCETAPGRPDLGYPSRWECAQCDNYWYSL
jgi:hypothetical protein